MNYSSLNHLGGIALIVGPILAIVFFLIQPGGILIDSADSTDAVASISAFASNAALTNITSIVVCLGLVTMVYGLYAVQAVTRDGGGGDALSRFGFLFILIGVVAWVIAQGLHLALSDTNLADLAAVEATVPVSAVDSSITVTGAIAVSFGLLMFSFALTARDDFNKVGAWVTVAVSVVALIAFIVAGTMPGREETATMIGRVCYFPWVIWSVSLGLNIMKRQDS